ncbi:MAG: right-handed parallel beta-helix repeat-containing protein [Flavobacteriales bacterium]|nr:right-handed parallel beta-helix repeat-containing protein [Flavobacteriales bacterium]
MQYIPHPALWSFLLLPLSLSAQLNGDYTIGGAVPDYATPSDAVAAVTALGVSGPVNFLIRDGVYNDNLNIHPIPGAGASNVVTFLSESGDSTAVSIEYPGNNVYLDNAEYVAFKRITFHATGTTLSRLVYIRNTTGHILFEGCIFSGFVTSSAFDSRLVECYGSDANSYMTFQWCRFLSGKQGIFLYGDGTTIPGYYNTIEGCEFVDQDDRGIICQVQAYLTVQHNRVTSNSLNQGYAGIYLQYGKINSNILANKVDLAHGAGIHVNNSDGNGSNPILVANNMVSNACQGTTNYGIRVEGSDYIRNYFNSVNLFGNDASSASFGFSGAASDLHVRLHDNCLRNIALGRAIIVSGTTLPDQSDHNDLYTNGAVLADFNGSQGDLAAWQLATGRDVNSVSVDPLYVSDTDLHLSAPTLDGLGTPLFGVTEDFDGELRDAVIPDIGADEVDMSVNVQSTGRPCQASIYPNPTSGPIHVEAGPNARVTCYDLQGRPVLLVFVDGHDLDLSGALPGIYFLQVEEHGSRSVLPLIKR